MSSVVDRSRASSVTSLVARILVLSFGATNAGASSPAPSAIQKVAVTAEQRIQNAREAIQSKRYGDAKKELKLALKLDQKSPAANLFLAFVYKQENKSKDATKYVQEAIKSQPNYPDAHYLFALLLFDKNDLARSRQEIDLAIAQGANSPNAYVLSGDIHLTQNGNKPALECYEKALRLAGPNDEGAAMLRDRVTALTNYVEFASHRADPSYVRPVQLNRPMPRYTEEARQRKVQGKVKMAVLVDEQGRVASVLIFSRLGYGLDAEAVNAATSLRFSPATRDGRPVPFWLQLFVEFNLR